MKYIKAVWAFFDLLNEIKREPEFKDTMDTILDMIEDTFSGKDVQKGCKVVRKLLNVPDDDD